MNNAKHSQSDKFKKMARELECHDDERFKERLKKIVKQKPIKGGADNET